MSRDRTHCPVVFFGMVGFRVCLLALLVPLGPLHLVTLPSSAWHPFWDQDDVQDMVDDVPVAPNIWTDGSREPIPHLDVEVAAAGAFVHSPAIIFDSNSNHWGHAQDLGDPHEGSSHIFSGVLGPIQSVQRVEYWGVILALQAYSGIHIGIDNLNVLRGVALSSQQAPR